MFHTLYGMSFSCLTVCLLSVLHVAALLYALHAGLQQFITCIGLQVCTVVEKSLQVFEFSFEN